MVQDLHKFLALGVEAGLRYKLVPPNNIPQGLTGERMGNRPGSSLEFMDHRDYMPGDDLRRIDWSAFARSDKLTVRLYREEIDPHLEIILDGSVSMNLPDTQKAQGASAVAAMLAQAASNSGFSYKLWIAGQQCREIPDSSTVPTLWQGISFDFNGSPTESLARPAGRMRSRAMRLLISDLLWEGDPMETMLRLTDNASSVFVVQVLADVDVNPPGPGNMKLLDSETGEIMEVYIDAPARKKYTERLQRHQQMWQNACRHCGAVMTTVTAEEFINKTELQDFIVKGVLQ